MLTTIVAFDSVIVSGLKLYGIYKIPSGPILNLFRFKSILNIFVSFDSRETWTYAGSLKGFLNINILDVLFPTAVEIG